MKKKDQEKDDATMINIQLHLRVISIVLTSFSKYLNIVLHLYMNNLIHNENGN